MYKIEDLEDTLNWSYDQIRDRIVNAGNRIEGVMERGQNNRILITEKGLSVLQQIKDLEDQGRSKKSSLETITKDLESSESPEVSQQNVKSPENSEVVELLKERVTELKEDKKRLEDKVDTLEQHLLTGEVDQNKSPFQRFWNWLGI